VLREIGAGLEERGEPYARGAGREPAGRVRLDVPRAELERRLRARDRGAELDEHLAMLDAPPEAANASGEGSPREVARAVLTVAGWRSPG
jgi:hypothetical protein